MKVLKAYKDTITVNDIGVKVLVSIEYDQDTLITSGWDDKALADEAHEAIFQGNTQCLYVQVRVTGEGLTAMTSLGQVIVRTSDLEKDIMTDVISNNMVLRAKELLEFDIENAANRLQRYIKGF